MSFTFDYIHRVCTREFRETNNLSAQRRILHSDVGFFMHKKYICRYVTPRLESPNAVVFEGAKILVAVAMAAESKQCSITDRDTRSSEINQPNLDRRSYYVFDYSRHYRYNTNFREATIL